MANVKKTECILTVNQAKHHLLVKPNDTLLEVLRDKLGLTGTKDGSSTRIGGWDIVIIDGNAVPASSKLALEVQGKNIETIEGVVAQKHPLIEAFAREDHIQGGYDTPGKVMLAKDLLDKNPNPTREEVIEALSGVIGREGTYPKDVEAVFKAAKVLGKGDTKKIDKELKRSQELETFIMERRKNQKNLYVGTNEITRANENYPKASGQAKFSRDVILPHMAIAKWLVSPYPRAKIKSVDTTEAKKIEGVVGIQTWESPAFKDLPKAGWFGEYPLISNETEFEGDEAGVIVVAEDEETCDKALEALKIEWEELPFVLDPEEALKPDAPIIHPDLNAKDNVYFNNQWYGNEVRPFEVHLAEVEGLPEEEVTDEVINKKLAEADHVIEGRSIFRPQCHAADDIASAVATWKRDHLHIWQKVQDPRYREGRLNALLGIPQTKIHIHLANVGGSFGGDLLNDRSGTRIHVAAAVLAREYNRPVKVIQNRRDGFRYSNPTEIADYKIGVNNDGTITTVSLDTIIDNCATGGGAGFWGPGFWNHPIRYFEYFTKVPYLRHNQKIVFTNKQPSWWFRCEKAGTDWITGSILTHVADELGMDVTQLGLKNVASKGIPSLKRAIEKGKELIDWNNKYHKPGEMKLENGKMHGIGFNWAWEWDSGAHGSVGIRIAEDGSVEIIGAAPDIGVAAHGAYRNTAAETLGIKPENVSYTSDSSDNTDRGFLLADFGGSWTMGGNVDIVYEAAMKAKAILLERASKILMRSPDLLDIKDGEIYSINNPSTRIPVSKAVGKYDIVTSVSTRTIMHKDDCPFGTWACPYGFAQKREHECFQAHFVELEVDPETGFVDIKKIVNINDVGRIIIASGVSGQQYGGSYMAVGRALLDELIHDPKTGALLNGNMEDYKIPGIATVGTNIIDVALEIGEGPGALGAVGVGEDISTDLPFAVASAVFNALGVQPKYAERPYTPDKILKTIGKAGGER